MNRVIYEALCACFALDPGSEEASVLIREAYQDPENTPRPPRETNIIYYSVSPDTVSEEIPSSWERVGRKWVVHRFSPWNLLVVCYGRDALANANKIRSFLFLDGQSFPRSILRQAGIYPIPDPKIPLELHEPEGSLWRNRADLTIPLRVAEDLTHPTNLNSVTVAPNVIIHYSR